MQTPLAHKVENKIYSFTFLISVHGICKSCADLENLSEVSYMYLNIMSSPITHSVIIKRGSSSTSVRSGGNLSGPFLIFKSSRATFGTTCLRSDSTKSFPYLTHRPFTVVGLDLIWISPTKLGVFFCKFCSTFKILR